MCASLISAWLNGRSPNTIDPYRRDARRFLEAAGKPIAEIALADVQVYADGLKHVAALTQARKLAAVKAFLTFAREQGYITTSPAGRVRLPKQ